jgi:hypothetical protein
MRKKVFMLILVCFFSLSFSAAEDLTPEKRADIEKLIRITGSMKIAEQMANAMSKHFTETVKAVRPDLPDRFYKIIDEEVSRVINEQMVAKGGFLDLTASIYGKYFTHKDIKGLIAFYQTELGIKTIRVLPQVMQESWTAAQLWGQALRPLVVEKVRKRLNEEGIDLSS